MFATNEALVHALVRQGELKSTCVRDAFLAVDRAFFTPARYNADGHKYADTPLPIGCNVTISAPSMQAIMLDMIALHHNDSLEGKRILDVGSGTGIICAYMGHCVGPNGLVVGIDHVKQLTDMSIQNLENGNAETKEMLTSGRVELITGDGRKGHAAKAPYDAIHVGAGAPVVPADLTDQLAPGGCLLIPVDTEGGGYQELLLISKGSKATGDEGKMSEEKVCDCRFVPLTDLKKQL